MTHQTKKSKFRILKIEKVDEPKPRRYRIGTGVFITVPLPARLPFSLLVIIPDRWNPERVYWKAKDALEKALFIVEWEYEPPHEYEFKRDRLTRGKLYRRHVEASWTYTEKRIVLLDNIELKTIEGLNEQRAITLTLGQFDKPLFRKTWER